MRKIQQEVKTYRDVFVSVDGKEFNTEADCREWEKSYRCTMETSWQLIKKIEVNSIYLGLPWSSDDHECYFIKPKDLDEITLINAYVRCITRDNCQTLTTEHIGKLIVLNFGYDRDYCDVYKVEGIVADIAAYIAKKTEEMEA